MIQTIVNQIKDIEKIGLPKKKKKLDTQDTYDTM